MRAPVVLSIVFCSRAVIVEGSGTFWFPEATDGGFAITSTSCLPPGRWYEPETRSAICCAAPRPPPLGFHDDHVGPGLIERPANTTTPTIAAASASASNM